MTTPTPNDPLDKFVYPDSDNWMPNMKYPKMDNIGKPLKNPDITKRPFFNLPQYSKPIDIISYRQLLRNQLLNSKAETLDRIIDDEIDANQAELAYRKQMEELKRLEQQFSDGLFSFFVKEVKDKATSAIQSEYFNNDTDLQAFDDETASIIEGDRTLTELGNELLQLQQEQLRKVNTIEQSLVDLVEGSKTDKELTTLSELNDTLKQLKTQLRQPTTETSAPDDTSEVIQQKLKRKRLVLKNTQELKKDVEELEKQVKQKPMKEATKEKAEYFRLQVENYVKRIKQALPYLSEPLPKYAQNIIDDYDRGRIAQIKRPKTLEGKAYSLAYLSDDLGLRPLEEIQPAQPLTTATEPTIKGMSDIEIRQAERRGEGAGGAVIE